MKKATKDITVKRKEYNFIAKNKGIKGPKKMSTKKLLKVLNAK